MTHFAYNIQDREVQERINRALSEKREAELVYGGKEDIIRIYQLGNSSVKLDNREENMVVHLHTNPSLIPGIDTEEINKLLRQSKNLFTKITGVSLD